MKYGIECDNKKENWITLQDLMCVSNRIIILHMYYRTSIMALTKKQPYWKYHFYESFWHRDEPRGSIKKLGNSFLKNKQVFYNTYYYFNLTLIIIQVSVVISSSVRELYSIGILLLFFINTFY